MKGTTAILRVMNRDSWQPVVDEDSGEKLGYICREHAAWKAMTVFGYVLARTTTQGAAESIIRTECKAALGGMWRYQDSDHEWYACILKEVFENRVVIIRTNERGIQESSNYKLVTIREPNETNFVKA